MHVLFSVSEKNCCPARRPSAFWTLWCIWDMLPFRIRLKSYFSVGSKWNECGGGKCPVSVPPPQSKISACILMCLNWKKCCPSWCLAAWGTFTCMRNYSRTSGGVQMQRWDVQGVWCQSTSSCKVKGLSPLQGPMICGIIVALHTGGDDSFELDKILHYRLFTF